MSKLEIDYNITIQPVCKAEIQKHLEPWLWLLPSWCLRLKINLWDSDAENDSIADTLADYNYRRIELSFYTRWMDDSDESKQRTVVHELIHASQAIVTDYARHSFETITNDQKVRDMFQNGLFHRTEGATEDLAMAILSRFKNK